MIRNEDNPEISVLPFLISPLTEPRGQIEFCKILIANLFKKGESPCTKKFPDVKIKRQLLDHYIKGTCSLTSHYGIYTKKSDHQMHFMTDISFKLMMSILNFESFYTIHQKHTTPKHTKSKLDFYKRCILTCFLAIYLYKNWMNLKAIRLLKHLDIQLYDRKHIYFQNCYMQFETI